MNQHVLLVDDQDRVIDKADKLIAHQQGLLHRAFSIFILGYLPESSDVYVLLQRRAMSKYHSAGLWSNACCSHPTQTDDIIEAAQTRLAYEMGMLDIDLQPIGSFTYQCQVKGDLIENEIDHVLISKVNILDVTIAHNLLEVSAYQWIKLEELYRTLITDPDSYTPWLGYLYEHCEKHLDFKIKPINMTASQD